MTSRPPIIQINSRGIFTFLALIFVALLLWLSQGYSLRARQVPETIAIFSIFCLLIQLLLDLFPRAGAYYGQLEKQGVLDVDEEDLKEARAGGETEFRLELISYGWLAFLLAGLVLLGFLVSIPIYILLYLRFQAQLTWPKSTAYAVGTWLFVYLLFVRLFEIRLYAGLLLETFFDF